MSLFFNSIRISEFQNFRISEFPMVDAIGNYNLQFTDQKSRFISPSSVQALGGTVLFFSAFDQDVNRISKNSKHFIN